MTWTHRERLLAALAHEQPDRVAIDFASAGATGITAGAYERLKRHLGVSGEGEVHRRLGRTVTPAEEVLERFDIDTRGAKPGAPAGGQAREVDRHTVIDEFGVTWKCSAETDDTPYLHKDGPFHDPATTIDDVEAFAWPDPDDPAITAGLADRVAGIRASGRAVVLYLAGGVVHRGYAMRGMERFLKDLYKNRELAQRIMQKLCDTWVGVAESALAAAGPENVDVVFFGEDLGTQDGCMFDPEGIYERLIKPHHRRMAETVLANSKAKICFHCCGSAYHFIDHLIDIGVTALNPVQVSAANMQPERLKAEFGDRLAFWGGIDSQQVLPNGSPAEVAAETRRIIEVLGRGGGYVLNSVHNLQPEVPPENIVAMFDAGREHRYG